VYMYNPEEVFDDLDSIHHFQIGMNPVLGDLI